MSAEKHNEFVTRAVIAIGRDLIDQGNFAEQMVALESVVAGLFALSVTCSGKTQQEADTFLSALTHGVRGRLPRLLAAAK
jgi:hypothetical protein